MLLAQHLSHLLLQGADALLCLAHLAGRFLTQLFGLLPELHTLQLSNQRLQAVDFAGVRRHPLREQTVYIPPFCGWSFAAPAAAPEAGRFHQGMRYP